jgi:hypothetical protein
MGLGRPVVWTCRQDHMTEAHFDTRSYNPRHLEHPSRSPGKIGTENPSDDQRSLCTRARSSAFANANWIA